MRSFVEPVGFWPSSFAQMRTPDTGERRCIPTSGVLPIASRIESYRTVHEYRRASRGQIEVRYTATRRYVPLLTVVKTPPTARFVPSVANDHTCLLGFGTHVGSTTPDAGSNATILGR